MSIGKSPKDVEKNPEGIVINAENSIEKMKVEHTEIKTEGDYKTSPVYIFHDWCVKCGICVAFCPTKTLGRNPDGSPFVEFPEKCIHCETCDRLCPNFAITGAKEK